MCNQKPESPHWIPAEAEGSVAPRLLSQNEVPKRLTSCGRARREEQMIAANIKWTLVSLLRNTRTSTAQEY